MIIEPAFQMQIKILNCSDIKYCCNLVHISFPLYINMNDWTAKISIKNFRAHMYLHFAVALLI